MIQTQARRWRRERGSALLLSLLVTLAGAILLGLTVDAAALLWARSHAQNTANLVAAAVALELRNNPAAPEPFLLASARAAAVLNGYPHGRDSVAVQLEDRDGARAVVVERPADVFFLRMLHPDAVPVRARAAVVALTAKERI